MSAAGVEVGGAVRFSVAGRIGVTFSLGACVKFSLDGVGVVGVLVCPQPTIEARESRTNRDTRKRQVNLFISALLLFGCRARIRTWAKGSKVLCATTTQLGILFPKI